MEYDYKQNMFFRVFLLGKKPIYTYTKMFNSCQGFPVKVSKNSLEFFWALIKKIGINKILEK